MQSHNLLTSRRHAGLKFFPTGFFLGGGLTKLFLRIKLFTTSRYYIFENVKANNSNWISLACAGISISLPGGFCIFLVSKSFGTQQIFYTFFSEFLKRRLFLSFYPITPKMKTINSTD